jgi:hypothetical protein
MIVSWVVAIALIIFARVATWDMKGVPGGRKTLWNGWSKVCTAFWKTLLARTFRHEMGPLQ